MEDRIVFEMKSDLARRGTARKMATNSFLNCIIELGQGIRLGRDSATSRIIPRRDEDIRVFILLDLEFYLSHCRF
jgi:hypothetical protein